jgi:Ca2+-binding RTX toxin-like protein
VATITGTPGNDILNGTIGDDTITGLGGNDSLQGGDGNDTEYGGPGNDFLLEPFPFPLSDEGDDVMYGGSGNDYFYGAEVSCGAPTLSPAPSRSSMFGRCIMRNAAQALQRGGQQ